MRNRPIAVYFRLNEEEHQHLQQQVELSGLSTAAFLRNMINHVEIQERPPEQISDLLHGLSAIGNNINQIARVANSCKMVRPADIDQIKQMQSELWDKVKNI